MFRKIRARWMRRKTTGQVGRVESPAMDTPEKRAELIKNIQAASNQPGRPL
jgi:hypothetical protein